MPSASMLTARIRREAERLGFFRMGCVAAGPLPRSESFDSWLNKGMHGEMAYMHRQAPKRRSPRLVLEAVKSILVLARNYHTGHPLDENPLFGKISRYAWGDDYHTILMDDLRALESFITREVPGSRAISYVDTGPIMEKVWGASSALGWMGKHTNLISREQGSWFFVGVILLDIELEYDVPEPDRCGSCVRCIDACPTGAIVAPYIVDARLCISYLTIELKGKVPAPLRPLIGNRIYGCDDCQEVCPWNGFAVSSREPGFQPREGNYSPELGPLVDITPDEFTSRFRNSPIRRVKRDGFVRNVVIALGNSRDERAVPPLSRALRDRSPLVRAHAVWAMTQIDSPEARRLLGQAREVESDATVLEEFLEDAE